jgi:SHS2 domain-containing protein
VYTWVDHTGELELALEAGSERGVFVEAASALGELLGGNGGGEPARHEIAVAARDRATLLAEWLSELVFLAETEAFVPERVVSLELEPRGVRAVVDGRRDAPPHLVKAITYHRLAFDRAGDAWRASVVLDV